MPGLSFLNNKTWHPSNKSNQKKIWVAEQKWEEQQKRDAEANAQLKRELDMYNYEQMAKAKGTGGLASEMDKKGGPSDIAFLYAKPPGTEMLADHGDPKDDQAVREFFLKAQQAKKRAPQFSMNSQVTALEKAAGKRKRDEPTLDEQVERFPFLKDAPLEGAYAKDIKVTFKPLGGEVRNVRCVRCGTWGHISGDRECPLKDFNPHDAARQKREDPLTYMRNDMILEKQSLVLKLGALPREMALSAAERSEGVVLEEDDEEAGGGFDDVDEEFLSQLSTKEKKLLLQRLKKMDGGGGDEGGGEEKESKRHKKKHKKDKKKDKKKKSERKDKKKKRRHRDDDSSSSDSD